MASASSESTEFAQKGEEPVAVTENQMNGDMETAHNDEAMARLLQRMKSDVMYELRNIEHSHRPVTGQEHRENLHQFMKKHIADPGQSKGNVPSNVDDVAEHRPQSVVVEVQGIVEQRPVSSVLQSAAFRHRLENIIRGSIQSSRFHNQPTSRPLRQQRQLRERTPAPSNLPEIQNCAGEEPNLHREDRSETVPRLSLQRRDSTDSLSSVDSFSSARSSVDQEDEIEAALDPTPISEAGQSAQISAPPIPRPRRTLTPPNRPSPSPSVPVAPQHENNAGDEGITWNDISRVHREEIVQELSELLHNRLVSSTLEGEFRATLEVLIEDRVDTNGPAVQEFVQSLPGRGIPRNDFSHLGIGAINDIDNSDNFSIASVSTHSVPYTQTNTYLGREIQSLKGQMKQMMNMIKMTHELQLDVQRSIRQEVSAALSQGESACAAPIPRSRPVQDTHCLICLEQFTDSVLYQCGHMCVCYLCGKNLISRKHCCPVCRAPIKDVIRVYKTNAE